MLEEELLELNEMADRVCRFQETHTTLPFEIIIRLTTFGTKYTEKESMLRQIVRERRINDKRN